jgi:hypothetical protein
LPFAAVAGADGGAGAGEGLTIFSILVG